MENPPQAQLSITILCFSLLFFFFFFFTTHLVSSELCNPADKKVLFKIKESFNNPYLLVSWQLNTDCCDWPSVECDLTTHRINSLTIDNGDINGQIPAAVGDLPYLETLIFRKLTNLTGTINPAIAKLKHLKFVWLSWTNLSGPVPAFLSQLKNLNYLNLSFNNLTGTIPASLSQLPNLETLSLDRNRLTGSIPESFGMFQKQPMWLRLAHNQLSGKIPTTLANVDFIVVELFRNKLEGDASMLFGPNKSTQEIDLSRNLLEFNLSSLENQLAPDLNTLDLSHNKIVGSLPTQLTSLPMLLFLNVSYNRLCGQIPVGKRLERFDQYSYFHNRCLCGAPLESCKKKYIH